MKNQRKANETELGAQFMAPSGESSGAEPSETCRDRGRGETQAHRFWGGSPIPPRFREPPQHAITTIHPGHDDFFCFFSSS